MSLKPNEAASYDGGADEAGGTADAGASEVEASDASDAADASSDVAADRDRPNVAPVAVDDWYIWLQGRGVVQAERSLLSNDTDDDTGAEGGNDALAASGISGTMSEVSTFGAMVSIYRDGLFDYDPASKRWGEDHFAYRVSDGRGGQAVGRANAVLQPTIVELGLLAPVAGDAAPGPAFGGFAIDGDIPQDEVGSTLAPAGDLNGDGYDDVLVGSPAPPNGLSKAYVIFGKSDTRTVRLHEVAERQHGFVIMGEPAVPKRLESVSGGGDVNGDGIADLLLGVPTAGVTKPIGGRVYVVFGKRDMTPVQLAAVAAGSGGFAIDGADEGELLGTSVAIAGDVNGDGIDDFALGAPGATDVGTGITQSGRVYVVFGAKDLRSIDLRKIVVGSGGFLVSGPPESQAGTSVARAHDVNGDGLADIVIGAPVVHVPTPDAGEAFVVFGKAGTEPIALGPAFATAQAGFAISAREELAGALGLGQTVGGAGDVNGDGFADVVIGAAFARSAFIAYGMQNPKTVFLQDLQNNQGGFAYEGAFAANGSSSAVSGAGDVDGDGYAEVLFGAQYTDGSGPVPGRAYVAYGSNVPAAVDSSSLSKGKGGFALYGATPDDLAGRSVSPAGDVNGDGYADFMIGAPWADPEGTKSGRVYIVFGGNFRMKSLHPSDGSAEKLVGTSMPDVLVGSERDDELVGAGGFDVLYGGAGADTLAIEAGDVFRVNGGSGFDTLRITGKDVSLDLPLRSTLRIAEIERIDLSAPGPQTLILDERRALALSRDTNLLEVWGTEEDTLEFDTLGFLANTTATTTTYTNGRLTLSVSPALIVRPPPRPRSGASARAGRAGQR